MAIYDSTVRNFHFKYILLPKSVKKMAALVAALGSEVYIPAKTGYNGIKMAFLVHFFGSFSLIKFGLKLQFMV